MSSKFLILLTYSFWSPFVETFCSSPSSDGAVDATTRYLESDTNKQKSFCNVLLPAEIWQLKCSSKYCFHSPVENSLALRWAKRHLYAITRCNPEDRENVTRYSPHGLNFRMVTVYRHHINTRSEYTTRWEFQVPIPHRCKMTHKDQQYTISLTGSSSIS